MRIAIYYEDHRRIGRNDGNPLYVWNVLQNQLGFEVHHLIPAPDRMDGFGKFDLNVWVDWGEDALAPILNYAPMPCPRPNVYWASDTHLGLDYRVKKAAEFDHVFVAQKEAVDQFAERGIKAEWLPHAVEPTAYPRRTMIKKYDVGFVGNINSQNRIEFLDRMFKEFPDFFYGRRLFEEAAEIYALSKVVLNPAINNDLNMRVFEVLGSGGFLLTQDVPGLHDLFQEGVHLVSYKTTDEAVEKAKYYLAHDEEREKIAAQGHAEVLAKHTVRHRVEKMLAAAGFDALGGCLGTPSPKTPALTLV